MTPKPKPKEEPVPINFRISPKEKEAWQKHAKKLGLPLATFLKKEINKVVFGSLINYEELVKSLLDFNTGITAAIVVTGQNKIEYKSENWESNPDLDQLIKMWGDKMNRTNPMKIKLYGSILNTPSAITLNGIKFSTILLSDIYLVLKSSDNSSYLLGTRKQDTILLVKILFEAEKRHILSDLHRTIEKMFPMDPYVPLETNFGESSRLGRDIKDMRMKLLIGKGPQESPTKGEIKKFYEIETQGDRRIYLKKWLERYKSFFNIPLKTEEQEIIQQIEKTIGKKIEHITSDKIFETWLHFEEIFLSWKDLSEWRTIDLSPDEDFPRHKFKTHIMTFSGHVILLSLEGVGLTELPNSIPNLKYLKYLNLSQNKISNIPRSIEELEGLEYLYLKENNLTNLNPSFGKLPNLSVLDLSKNAIDSGWPRLVFNENIQRVDLRENPVKLFNIRQSFRDLVEKDIILIDEFQLDESVSEVINNTKK